MSIFLHLLLTALLGLSISQGQTLQDDGIALLAVKKAVKYDPLNALRSWTLDDRDPCSWTGITCSSSTTSRRIVSVNLTGVLLDSCSSNYRHAWEEDSQTQKQQQQQSSLAESTCLQNGIAGPCRLEGFLAPEIGNLSQLESLILPYNGFSGELPKEISGLRRLQILELQQNAFVGGIPEEFGNLSSLQVLNLEGNSLEGAIPQTLGNCHSLVQLRLGGNKLSGEMPASLGSLPRLKHLSLPSNELNNGIPSGLQGSCGTLEYLDLGNNFFTRGVPSWLGNCSKLQFLVLKSNYLVGSIPSELGRLSMLRVLDISMNRLGGQVPASLGDCLELTLLVLTNPSSSVASSDCTLAYRWGNAMKQEFNQFAGPLPSAITALPKLEIFWAPLAALAGEIADGWGACQSLRSLNLALNNFTGRFPPGLGRCSSLVYLDLSSNNLQGELPQLPTSCMVVFNVSRNNMSGEVPVRKNLECNGRWGDVWQDSVKEDFANPSKPFLATGNSYCGKAAGESCTTGLTVAHDLSSNRFTGPVPAPLIGDALMEEEPVYLFLLADNQLSGSISSSFFAFCGRLKALAVDLSNNQIGGELSGQDVGGCGCLLEFNASNNQIGQTLPKEFGSLSNLTLLDLSRNRLLGQIPASLGELQLLKYLVLAKNSFTGGIPEGLSRASSLGVLDLSNNELSGNIPTVLGNLSHLEYLILNNNSITGTIPEALIHMSSLLAVNFAFNNLSGSVPNSGSWFGLCDVKNFKGNPYLQPCSTVLSAPAALDESLQPVAAPQDSPPRAGLNIVVIVAITSGCAVAVVLFVLALLVQCTKQRVPRPPGNQGGRKEVVTFTSISFRFTYENVVRATGNFSVDYLIGNGGFGATYKAEMVPGLVVAVKRLAIGRFQGVQQFDTEIRTLGRIQHPNLVTLIGYHASEAEMFLIYNYFPRGNLESFIHNRSRGEITWQVVLKIALGIAEALAYLHDECVPRVLHRDIKPSNILLDNNLTAFLADFGLARLLGASETHATTDVAGTFGYVAPEYAMTCRVSDKADVYSYGVVLLELVSGKKALDLAFSDYGHGFNIVGWACLLIGQGRAPEVFIAELWEMGPENYLLETLKLAVMCTVDSLTVRPTMRQVVDRLRHIQSSLPFP